MSIAPPILDIRTLQTFFLPELPIILAYVVGLILAIKRWRCHPRVSRLAAIAFGLLIVASLVGTSLDYQLLWWLQRSGRILRWLPAYFSILNIARSVLCGAGWMLLLIALYGWRYPPSHVSLESDLNQPTSH